ncbi:MAG: 3-hydroxyisobutyrate dehydrogenase [Alcaligenaceae bacterium]|nr:3-hydroxyisobutyrate dehydrogenase [Alcaligenaceae bacterium]
MKVRVGFIGLGAMGFPMAVNMAEAGHDVLGMDIDEAVMQRFMETGGKAALSVAKIVAHSDVVVTMLPAGDHVKACVAELIGAGYSSKLLVDFSTIGVEAARDVHELCARHGIRVLDAPVTGGVMGAEKGSLTVMVGGSHDDFQAAKPVLEAVGASITYAGGPGCGQAVKVCNNMAAGIIKIAVCEAFALAERLGVDKKVLFDVASHGSANCFALTTTCPVPGLVPTAPSSHGYKGGFATRLMLKDMKLAQSAAAAYGVPVALGSAATSLYEHCTQAGLGDLDNSIIFKVVNGDFSYQSNK